MNELYDILEIAPIIDEWNKAITRGEMARLSIKTAEVVGNEKFPIENGTELLIKDIEEVKESKYAKEIVKGFESGVVAGNEKGEYKPKGTATRA